MAADTDSPNPAASHPNSGWRRLGIGVLFLLAAVPVWRVLDLTADARRNVVYWDEFDTTLAFVLKLDSGPSAAEFVRELFSINSEHRMVVSRLIFAANYWLTGGIDFVTFNWIGNLAILAACLALVLQPGAAGRRLLLGLTLSVFVFQLGNYENLVWSGASIDHFVVILFAVLTCLALSVPGKATTAIGIATGLAATFTLAHGLAIWPAGAFLLAQRRRRRALIAWLITGMAAAGLFLTGFRLTAGEAVQVMSIEQAARIALYWLALLGSTPALGNRTLAPVAGVMLVILSAFLLRRRGAGRNPVFFTLLLFLGFAASLIAIGRAEHAKGIVFSRYQIISALAWAIILWLATEGRIRTRRPRLALTAVVTLLLGFNFALNRGYRDKLDSWITCRDLAVNMYIEHGEDGRGDFTLHPNPTHSTSLLKTARRRGLYAIEAVCNREEPSPRAVDSGRITYHIETVDANPVRTVIKGWGGIDGVSLGRGAISVILRRENISYVYSSVTVPRNDVPAIMRQPNWGNAGFSLALPAADIPSGEYRIGLLVHAGGRDEYVMTARKITIPDAVPRAAD